MVHSGPGTTAHGHVTRGASIGRGLEHRRVHDPHEGERLVIDESEMLGNLAAGRTEQGAGGLRLAGGEEDAVAGVGPGGREQTRLLGLVLGDRSGQGAVLLSNTSCNTSFSYVLLAVRRGSRRWWPPGFRSTSTVRPDAAAAVSRSPIQSSSRSTASRQLSSSGPAVQAGPSTRCGTESVTMSCASSRVSPAANPSATAWIGAADLHRLG